MYAVRNDDDTPNLLLRAIIFPASFVIVLWLVKSIEVTYDLNFSPYGIYPRSIKGLIGIITGNFIHDSFNHLINNSAPLLILGTAIFYSYRDVKWKIFFWSWFMTNLWVWAAAREAWHLGASGLVYAFASFVFFSGIIRKNIRLMGLSLLVVFLYGSMVWGIFPIDYRISFESHLFGSLAGLLLAIYFRKEGPQREVYSWELEEEEENPEAKTADCYGN